MTTYDASRAECLIFTFKEGLLSAVAHDLKLRVSGMNVDVDGDQAVRATFDASSIQVVCARKNGADAPELLSAANKEEIQANIRKDVLGGREISFRSSKITPEGGSYRVEGELTLNGKTKPVAALVQREGDRYVTEVTIHQPDFGIKPYSAMLGTLKVQPDVKVRIAVPAA
jgi:polyisoprenoid-binding protein YceI